jgi:hypothetical protein
MIEAGRFPSPWSVEERHACFVVLDHSGQTLSYIYFEVEGSRRRSTSKLLSKDEARQIAAHIAKLPELLQ